MCKCSSMLLARLCVFRIFKVETVIQIPRQPYIHIVIESSNAIRALLSQQWPIEFGQ